MQGSTSVNPLIETYDRAISQTATAAPSIDPLSLMPYQAAPWLSPVSQTVPEMGQRVSQQVEELQNRNADLSRTIGTLEKSTSGLMSLFPGQSRRMEELQKQQEEYDKNARAVTALTAGQEAREAAVRQGSPAVPTPDTHIYSPGLAETPAARAVGQKIEESEDAWKNGYPAEVRAQAQSLYNTTFNDLISRGVDRAQADMQAGKARADCLLNAANNRGNVRASLAGEYYNARVTDEQTRLAADSRASRAFEDLYKVDEAEDAMIRLLEKTSRGQDNWQEDARIIADALNITVENSGGMDAYRARLQTALSGGTLDARRSADEQTVRDSGLDPDLLKEARERQETAQKARERQTYIAEETKRDPWGMNLTSVLLSPLQGAEYVSQSLGNIGHNDTSDLRNYRPLDANAMPLTDTVSGIRDATAQNIDNRVLSFLYQTGMSIADSTAQIAALGPASVFVMAGSSAANQMRDVLQRGGTNRQAILSGAAAGAAEALFEKVSIDNLLAQKSVTGLRSWLAETAKQMGVEASEETFTEIANILSDAAIMGENSDFRRKINDYTAQGLTPDQAKRRAYLDSVKEVALAGLGGALSGGLMGGAVNAMNGVRNIYNPLIETYDRARNQAAAQAGTRIQGDTPTDTPTAPAQTNPAVGQSAPAVVENAEGQNNTALSAGAESLVSAENMARYRKEIDGVFDGSLPSGRMILVGETPTVLLAHGANTIPLTMSQSGAMKIAYPENYFGGKHNLGISAVKNIPYQIADPLAITRSNTQKDSLVILTDWTDEHGNSVIIPIHLNKQGALTPENRIASAYGRDLRAILGTNNANVIYTRNNENINQLLSSRLQLPEAMADDTLITSTVPQTAPNVNPDSENQSSASPEFHNIGAAQQGFTTPTHGNIVYTQNETMSHGVDLTEEERERYTPGVHERVTAQMSRERAEGLFYEDENGNVVNVEDTVNGLLEKDAWTGVEQDAAQMAFRQMKDRLRDLTPEQYNSFQALSRAIEEIGGTEAGRSLQARQKWVDSGDGIVSETMHILDDPRIDPNAARRVMEQVGDLSQRFDDAGEAGNIDDYFSITREAALTRRTSRGTNEQIKRTAEWAMKQIKAHNDMEFARSAARASIVAMAQDYVPRSLSAQVQAFRRDAMLSKISTWARNVVSNNVFDPIDSIARDISVPLDIALSRLTHTRSTALDASWFSAAKRQGANYGAARAFLECALDISAEGAESRYGQAGNRTFRTTGNVFQRFMSQWEKISNYAMYSTDQWQKGGIQSEIQRGIDRLYDRGLITDESLRNAGEQEATFRTFQEDSALASGLSAVRRGLNSIAHVGEMGLGDILMPFVQVPANLVDITVDYSPLGIARGIYRLTDTLIDARRGTMTAAQQARAVQTVGRSLTGTGILALAVIAKMAGALIISDDGRDEDKDKAALESQANLSGTQVNLSGIKRFLTGGSAKLQPGDTLMSIGFMDPLNALLNMGGLIADDYLAEHEGEENGVALGEIFSDAASGVTQSLMDLPMMSPLAEAAQAYQYSKADTEGGRWMDAAKQYAAGQVTSLVPNLVKGVAQGFDSRKRDLYSGETLGRQTQDSLMSSLPFLRQKLPVKQDSFGQEMDSGNRILNALNNNILPGSIVQYQPRNEVIENWLDDLYSATGSVTMYPDKNPPNSISKDTDGDGKAEKFELTAEDKRQYKTTYGNILIDLYDRMLNSQGTITPEELVDIASDLKSYAGNQAKQNYFDTHNINAEASTNSVNKAVQAIEDGITLGQYYQL
ncbi:hypothetical protein, partial [uncultured Dysosmobacter sp.]|uniref:MuF-C-terminal domain-containing protein n=1 Tax=uncultured Dysosmobacter sp. TaxID=2591384 RepID=UPI002626E7A1